MASSGALNARDRREMLGRLATERFDVLVIGGGVTGAGTALDAASRGLRVALVEARDLASGTSSRSSKLIHGGLRYLEQFDFKLVYDAQVDDARHTLTVARTAAAHSAVIGTRLAAVGLLRSADGGRVTGARVRDEESGRVLEVSAEAVVICAGVWTDLVHELADVQA